MCSQHVCEVAGIRVERAFWYRRIGEEIGLLEVGVDWLSGGALLCHV